MSTGLLVSRGAVTPSMPDTLAVQDADTREMNPPDPLQEARLRLLHNQFFVCPTGSTSVFFDTTGDAATEESAQK